MSFVHLHTHSHYSLLDGLSKIPDLVKKAKDLGQNALALTDHGVMYGAIEFYKTCVAEGIKPIIGCEVYVAEKSRLKKDGKKDSQYYHLTLLAKNQIGYKNLIKIVSDAHLRGYYYKPRTDKKYLSTHFEGLFALSGCPGGELPQTIIHKNLAKTIEIALKYQEIFGKDNFYIEIQPHEHLPEIKKINDGLREVAKKTGIPLVATNDSHYLNKEDKEAHEVLLKINTSNKSGKEESGMSLKEFDLYLFSEKEMQKRFPENSEAIANSQKIADQIDLKFEFGKYFLPKFNLPKGEKTAYDYLAKQARAGFGKKYDQANRKAQKQLEYELTVIKTTGFADYFLIVADIVNWAKSNGIYTNTRGSAAGSIVSYCLNISNLDPLQFNLIFERFLNPERISMPDIDVDIADDRRQEMINYIVQTYGKDNVCQIITFGVMKARMVVRDVTRALGYPYELGDRIAKQILMGLNIETALGANPDLQKIYREDEAKKIIDMGKKLENVARHASTHAAGVVITEEPLVNYIPLQRTTGNEDTASTQYPMYDVELLGLLKLDALGLKNLTIMKNACRIIKKVHHKNIDIYQLDYNDQKTFELLQNGETVGVFQLESSGMRRYIKELQPTHINDIMAMVALYRPGPMEYIPDYIAGKHKLKEIKLLHPKLEKVLADTYGIAVYQEQILQIAREVAGFSYGEADILRKAIGKKNKKLLQAQRKKFIDGAVNNGTEKILAGKLFDFAEPFARYGFNRAHAASYAIVAYQTAYLKANFPECFMAALLTSDKNNLDKVAIAISESEKMGIKILPPDINESFVDFGVVADDKKIIRYGLEAIKSVGQKVAENIVSERQKNGPYKNLEDFLSRHKGQTVNKKVIEALTKSGALDALCERNMALAGINEILQFIKGQKINIGQADLFGDKLEVAHKNLVLPETAPASSKQKLAWEKEFIGIYLSAHPLDNYRALLEKQKTKINDLTEKMTGKNVKVLGLISTCKKITTRTNQQMMFCRLEDLSGNTEVIVFPKMLEENNTLWRNDNIVAISGKVNTKDGAIKIIANTAVEVIDQNALNEFLKDNLTKEKTQITLTIDHRVPNDALGKLKIALEKFPGDKKVLLRVAQNGGYAEKYARTHIVIKTELVNELKGILGEKKIKVE